MVCPSLPRPTHSPSITDWPTRTHYTLAHSALHPPLPTPPHSRTMASKPFLISPKCRYAPTNASEAPVPFPFPRPEPTTITDTCIHYFHLSRPLPICGEAISPPICIKPLPITFE
jgi:hypothetical protein